MHAGAPVAHPGHTASLAPIAPASRGSYYSNPGSLFPPPGITSTRPVFYSNGIQHYADTNHHERRNGYGGVGFVTLGYPLGYPGLEYDPDFLDPTYNPNTTPEAAAIPESLAAPQPVMPETAPQDAGPYREPEPAPSPYVAAPVSRHAPEPAPLPEEDAVTIVFKDGRPSEQIRNYALTRTALYITTGHVRTIPIDQIDIFATEAINEKAGLDFHLPTVK